MFQLYFSRLLLWLATVDAVIKETTHDSIKRKYEVVGAFSAVCFLINFLCISTGIYYISGRASTATWLGFVLSGSLLLIDRVFIFLIRSIYERAVSRYIVITARALIAGLVVKSRLFVNTFFE